MYSEPANEDSEVYARELLNNIFLKDCNRRLADEVIDYKYEIDQLKTDNAALLNVMNQYRNAYDDLKAENDALKDDIAKIEKTSTARPCIHYMTRGKCKYGSNCGFSHIPQGSIIKTLSQLQTPVWHDIYKDVQSNRRRNRSRSPARRDRSPRD